VEDIAHARRIARLHAFSIGVAPELEPFLLMLGGPPAAMQRQQSGPNARQLALTTAGMVAVVNSVVMGVCAGVRRSSRRRTAPRTTRTCGTASAAG
jgi:hypothetical protein